MALASAGLGGVVRGLYLVAMAIFVLTVGIGILNGTDVVDFARNWILTHVHSGTLGWISLSIVATASWYFVTTDRRLADRAGHPRARLRRRVRVGRSRCRGRSPGTPPARRDRRSSSSGSGATFLAGERGIAGLGIVLGLSTFAYGAIIGVVLQIQAAAEQAWLTGDAIGAHAAAMAFGYLVLVAMGVVEWQLRRHRPTASGPGPGGGSVRGRPHPVGRACWPAPARRPAACTCSPSSSRSWRSSSAWRPPSCAVAWARVGPARHIGAAAIWVVLALLLLMYLIVLFIGAKGDLASIPQGALIAGDHAVFIGVMTNLLLGLIGTVARTAERRPAWVDQLVFWGVNIGLAVFVVGLIAVVPEIKRVGAPVMGVAILLGLAVRAIDLWQERRAGDAGSPRRVAAPASRAPPRRQRPGRARAEA